MLEREFICDSESDTLSLGRSLAALLTGGECVALNGGLGAGKTALVRGVGLAFGTDCVQSPTFTIVREYDTTPKLYHFDAYRLAGSDELYAIGFTDYLASDAVVMIEWADIVLDALPPDRLDVTILGDGGEPRRIRFRATGARHEEVLRRLC